MEGAEGAKPRRGVRQTWRTANVIREQKGSASGAQRGRQGVHGWGSGGTTQDLTIRDHGLGLILSEMENNKNILARK